MAQTTNTAIDNTPKTLPEVLRQQGSEQSSNNMNMGSQMNDLINLSFEIESIKIAKMKEASQGKNINTLPADVMKENIKKGLTKEFESDEMLVNRSWAAFYGKKKDKLVNELNMLKIGTSEKEQKANMFSSTTPTTTEKTMLEKAKEFTMKNKWYIIALVGTAIIFRKPIMKIFKKA